MKVQNETHLITSLAELRERYPEAAQNVSEELLDTFPMAIPEYYLNLIDFSNDEDPIFKMCIPSPEEFCADGVFDTSGEGQNTVIEGLQHKYKETALILSTNQCAMYCRYCFRKRMVGLETRETVQKLDEVIAYIVAHPSINNVLISGGDSLLNSNAKIARYLERLTEIEHLHYIRFGSKVPIVFPQRITEDEELQEIFRSYAQKKQIYIITQFNHVNELTPKSVEALKCLQGLGLVLKNQSVLLRGVNDSPEAIVELFNRLTCHGVVPYYLFQCRPVAGVKNHFQVPMREGIRIVDEVKRRTNGNAKGFRYVLSNEHGKLEILGAQQPDTVLLRYHQAKDEDQIGVIFTRELRDDTFWIHE